MNWQEIIVLIIVGYALYYLATKFIKKDNCNDNNCDCSQMKYLQTYLKRISILLGMYTASRVFFYFNNIDNFTSATILEFIEGLRFDISALVYINIPIFLLFLLPHNYKGNKYYWW